MKSSPGGTQQLPRAWHLCSCVPFHAAPARGHLTLETFLRPQPTRLPSSPELLSPEPAPGTPRFLEFPTSERDPCEPPHLCPPFLAFDGVPSSGTPLQLWPGVY